VDLKHLLKDYKGFLSRVESSIWYLYLLSLIYNNIKPINIILDNDNNPILTDFDTTTLIDKT